MKTDKNKKPTILGPAPAPWPWPTAGHRRSGAGVKAKDGCQNLARHQVSLDEQTVNILTVVGGGELSLGIREAARRLEAAGNMLPFTPKKD